MQTVENNFSNESDRKKPYQQQETTQKNSQLKPWLATQDWYSFLLKIIDTNTFYE
jgi:hypothetical protein